MELYSAGSKSREKLERRVGGRVVTSSLIVIAECAIVRLPLDRAPTMVYPLMGRGHLAGASISASILLAVTTLHPVPLTHACA